jgi:hypothetical protein
VSDEDDLSRARPNPYATRSKRSVAIRLDERTIAQRQVAWRDGASLAVMVASPLGRGALAATRSYDHSSP